MRLALPKYLAPFSVLALALTACSDIQAPLESEHSGAEPLLAISDAAHGGTNQHFFWLPPLVSDPGVFNGAFNGAATPTVAICLLNSTGTECEGTQPAGLPITFGMESSPGSETVRVVPDDELYIVNWHTDLYAVSPGPMYRISVVAGDTQLGFADVELAAKGSELRDIDSGETITLVDGRTLPIKFRLEDGVPIVISAEEGGTVEALGGEVTVEIPPGALAEETGITVEPIVPTGDALVAVEFGPDGLQFDIPVIVTLTYDETALGGLNENDLALRLVGDGRVIPGSSVDPPTNTVTAPFHHFSGGEVGPAALAIFCPADADSTTFELLSDAIDAVMVDGIVEVCAGTHTLATTGLINKAITLEGASGTRPTLTTVAGNNFVLATYFDSGIATVRNLVLESGPAFGAFVFSEPYSDTFLDDVDILVTDPGSMGIVAGRTLVPNARATIHNVSVTDGNWGVRGLEGARIDVLNSTFTGQGRFGIGYFWGASGLIQDNTISPCGEEACVRVFGPGGGYAQAEPLRIIGNQLTATAADQTLWGLFVSPGDQTFEIRDNSVIGVPPVGDRTQSGTYSFTQTGIRIQSPAAAGDLSGNTLFGVRGGILMNFGTVSTTGLDNVITAVRSGVSVRSGGLLSIHSSDITDYVNPIGVDQGTSDLTCNWWGDAGGPIGVDGAIAPGVYTPWITTGPVAGTSTTSC